jgi:hypothetical protein
MRPVGQSVAAMAAAAAITVCGCGSGSHRAAHTTSAPAGASGTGAGSSAAPSGGAPGDGQHITLPSPGPTGKAAAPAAIQVIRAWADSLRRGDVRAAARYFAVPSEMINGPDASGMVSVLPIRSRNEAVAANATLPCGATFLRADQRGRYVNVLFRIGPRTGLGGGCQGPRGTGRVNFVIRGGSIAQWIRARDETGDQAAAGLGKAPPSASPSPSPGTGSPGPGQAASV